MMDYNQDYDAQKRKNKNRRNESLRERERLKESKCVSWTLREIEESIEK